MSYSQRDADYVIQRAYLAAQRKATPPASTTTKYATLLGLVDAAQDDWQTEPGIEWNSLYELVSNGTVTATDTFDLDDSIRYVSKRDGDFVTLTNGTNTQEVLLVNPDQLYSNRYNFACAQIGRTLKFSKAFTASSTTFGYTIKIPAIIYCDDITAGSSAIQCDDPMYLAYMVAAEFIRTDVVKGGQYNNLLGKAAERMDKMKQDNGSQNDSIPRETLQVGESWI